MRSSWISSTAQEVRNVAREIFGPEAFRRFINTLMVSSQKSDLIRHSMDVEALKFGSFVLKSGRVSPYFFNAGLLCTGQILSTVSSAYALTIHEALESSTFPTFNVLFGPAYKGISLAAVTSLTLWTQHGMSIGIAYDRKEVKDHGEGGKLVGSSVRGKKVVILDDVMTSGKAIRGAIESVVEGGGEVVGVVQLLDREEIGQGEVQNKSTVEEIEELVGGRVISVLKMRDLMVWLEDQGMGDELDNMKVYRDRYGFKV